MCELRETLPIIYVEKNIWQLTYDYDFKFNDLQINFDDVPVTISQKHGAQTSGTQTVSAYTGAPKCHVPNF